MFLEPRVYLIGTNELIQEQNVEVDEVIYMTKGKIGVGYRLFNEVFLGMALTNTGVINDYAMT